MLFVHNARLRTVQIDKQMCVYWWTRMYIIWTLGYWKSLEWLIRSGQEIDLILSLKTHICDVIIFSREKVRHFSNKKKYLESVWGRIWPLAASESQIWVMSEGIWGRYLKKWEQAHPPPSCTNSSVSLLIFPSNPMYRLSS